MAVKIRLQRGGATHYPKYRLVVADSKKPRDGRFVEVLGTYDPKNKSEDEQLKIDLERADYWRSVGAQPSDTVRSLINRARRQAARTGEAVPAAVAEAGEEAPAKAEAPVEKAPAETAVATEAASEAAAAPAEPVAEAPETSEAPAEAETPAATPETDETKPQA